MDKIQSILRFYPLECRPSQIDPLGSAGGMSGAEFWRITAPRGTLALRRWPLEHPTPERLRFIHAVLRHAAQRDIAFLPLPIRATSGESFICDAGHLWELAPWMPGTADYERAPSIDKLCAAMQALAEVHIALADCEPSELPDLAATQRVAGPSPAVTRRLVQLHELQRGGADKLSHAVTTANWPELAPLAHRFLAALPAAVPRVIAQLALLADMQFKLQPCLRDIWHDHVLFTGNEVSGLIDFGAVDIDSPTCDIARLLGSLVNDDISGWQTGLAAYSSIRPLSQDDIRAVIAIDSSGTVLAGCNWLRWVYVEGRRFDDHAQVIDRVRRIVLRCCNNASLGAQFPASSYIGRHLQSG
ncbi:MAG: aminoglycoside phosphotransferase family protein [Pirellulales bacterium]